MRYAVISIILTMAAGGAFFVLTKNNNVEIITDIVDFTGKINSSSTINNIKNEPVVKNIDIENQKPLSNPPEIIKAIYLTGWSAGSNKKINQVIDLIKNTELNSVVIDIKDYSGYIAYDIKIPDVEKYKAKEIKIPKINSLIKKLHDENIYVIARITIFQDPVLAKVRPDLAIHSKVKCPDLPAGRQVSDVSCQMSLSTLWFDNKKLAWIDPAAKEAWDYNIAIAKDAAGRGFDELNFDYIRFASDGNLKDMVFPFWNGEVSKRETIRSFFKYLREQLQDIKISADFFGLVTIQNDDLGIGQIIEDAYAYFDYVSPMVYPSHYAKGFLNYKNPAQYPYEVVRYSMDSALKRLKNNNKATTTEIYASKLRPWLQDFNLGAKYDAKMVKEQIQAVYDAASSTPELTNGWMLWNPANNYTRGALISE